MEGFSVCTPQLAESDANTLSSSPGTDGDKSINTKIKSAQTEGHPSDTEMLKGLLTDDYCHVCEAMLFFEPQKHYEGKRHGQQVKLYLQNKRAEGTKNEDSGGLKRDVPMDRDRFCELCNMIFSSPVVAESHYQGKVHGKNLRKQRFFLSRGKQVLNQPGLPTHCSQISSPDKAKPKSAQRAAAMGLQESAICGAAASPRPDPKDTKYCVLCAAPFNNPQMALQHYNGRKHQRNQARQKMLQDLGEDAEQASCLICQVCNAQFNSVEMYQAHMQGNKHQVKEKKVIDLCKSQQKDYSSFADELADYIQVQKARGINTPTPGHPPPQGVQQKDGESKEADPRNSLPHGEYVLNRPPVTTTTNPPSSNPLAGLSFPASGWRPPPLPPPPYLPGPPGTTTTNPPSSNSLAGPSFPAAGWRPPPPPPYLPGPSTYHHHPHPHHSFSGMPGGWEYSLPRTGAPQPPNPNRPGARKRHSEQSSSSSYSSSSPSSSSSSYSSDSEEEERRRARRHRSTRTRRVRERDSDEEVCQAQRRKRARRDRSQERRGGEEGEDSRTESRRKRHQDPIRRRRQEKRHEESAEGKEAGEMAAKDGGRPPGTQKDRAAAYPEDRTPLEQAETRTAKSLKPKPRKDKKKHRETEDKRTEEEKLWDESILGL